MAKERNRHGGEQQITILSSSIFEAVKEYAAEETKVPFEYRHFGFLFSEAKAHFEDMGFILEWHRSEKNDEESYWAFKLPENANQILAGLR